MGRPAPSRTLFDGVIRRTTIGFGVTFLAALLSHVSASAQQIPSRDLPAQSFEPPPRSISDITAILAQKPVVDRTRLEAMRNRADRTPLQTTDPTTLAKFYLNRGRAARGIGRVRQAIEDLTKANELGGALPGNLRGRILYYLALAELAGGDHIRGTGYIRKALEAAEQEHLRIEYGATLANTYLSDSKLIEARNQLAASEARAERLRQSGDPKQRKLWRRHGDIIQARLSHIRGRYLNVLGRHDDAENFLRSAIWHYTRHYDRADRRKRKKGHKPFRASPRNRLNHALGALGVTLLRLGRLSEAEVVVRQALLHVLKHRGRDDRRTAKFGHRLAWVMLRQGRPKDAETLERAMLQIMKRIGVAADSVQVGGSRKVLAIALFAQGKWQEALQQFRILESAFSRNKILADRFYALSPAFPLVLLKNGNENEALAAARYAVNELTRHKILKSENVAQARGVLAVVLKTKSQRLASLEEFGKAVPVLLELKRRSGFGLLDPVQDSRSKMILDSYLSLLAKFRGTAAEKNAGIDASELAFQVADSMGNEPVRRALNAAATRVAAKNRELSDLLRRLQDTIGQIAAKSALQAEHLSRPNLNEDALDKTFFPETAARLAVKRDSLRARIDKEFPLFTDLVSPKPPSLVEARAALREGETLIAIYGGENETYVWAVPKDGQAAFKTVPVGAQELASLVNRIRQGLSPTAASLQGISDFDVGAAHQLYRMLLAPVAESWVRAKSLVIVAHGTLAQIPFSLLVTEDARPLNTDDAPFSGYRKVPWLVRHHAVTALPTVSSLVTLRKLPAAKSGRRPFVGFADPWFSEKQKVMGRTRQEPARTALASRGLPLQLRSVRSDMDGSIVSLESLPPLPDTAQEVSDIAALMGADRTRDLYLGARANEQLVKNADLERYRIIAFASHALRAGELPGLSQPALALTAPAVAKIEGDGLLTAQEILGLRLNADWVILSACNTAMGDGRGSEAVAGLGRAFLYAGTRALLVSHWQVETVSARRLVTLLFAQHAKYPELRRGEALRRAMLALMDGPGFMDDKGRTVFSYAHPIFWAPFSLVGDGGGA